MSRPNNKLVLLPNGTVLSVPPKAVKKLLEAVAAGNPADISGKVLGTVDVYVANLTAESARSLLTASALTAASDAPSETDPELPSSVMASEEAA